MNAQQAREKALKSTASNYPEIQSKINEAVGKGEMYIWWYKKLNDKDKELIAADGYTIPQEGLDRNEYLAKISWEPVPKARVLPPSPSSSPIKRG